MLCAPSAPLSLDDVQRTSALLLASGCNIDELNVVRKHIDDAKGGRLADLSRPVAK